VTIALLVMHIPVAYLVAVDHLTWAGALLILLGLFDTLDGELARLQKRVTDIGGLLDTVSDRIKELLVYSGLVYYFAATDQPAIILLVTIIACGASLITPFVKAKGEAIISTYGHELSYDRLSRIFQEGLLPYAFRIALLSVGLIAGREVIPWVTSAIAILGVVMVIERLSSIAKGMR
jgi:phosphatidylglycerophosphate synthase